MYFNDLKDKALHWPLNLNSFVFSWCWLVVRFLFLDNGIYFSILSVSAVIYAYFDAICYIESYLYFKWNKFL